MLLLTLPRRLAIATLLLLAVLAVSASAQPGSTHPITTACAARRVKGLSYDASASPGGQSAKFSFSVDGGTVKTGRIDLTCPYTAIGVGKRTVNVLVTGGAPPYRGALTFAIGGPLAFGKVGGSIATWDRDEDAPLKPRYLQYFGIGPDGPFSPNVDQVPQMASASAAIMGTPTDTTTSITVGATGDSGTSKVKLVYTYTDPTDAGLTGSAEDDTDEVPASDGQIHTAMYRLHCHGPKTLALVSKTSARPSPADVAIGVPNTPSPWNKPHPYGYGVADYYKYQLQDAEGSPMPNVSVAEGFFSISGNFPPDPALPPDQGGPAVWETSGWSDTANRSATSGFFSDYIALVRAFAAHTKAGYPNSPSSVFTHYYRAGLLKYSGSRGIPVLTTTTKTWTDATSNTVKPPTP